METIKELSDKLLKEATSQTPNPQLMEILYLSTILRDKIHLAKNDPDENLNFYDWYDDFDKMQTDLNEFKAKVGEMIAHLLICDFDNLKNTDL
ncbi:hypothetical protein [Dysgonomonas sp.]